ncbi:hypothetical protein BJX63DRAFT_436796 [Aspergillus granulosus]|uniref:Uncharacterized protein n=1 Tax=Aspergillus granulosus TaxID=176169 RepID=A0ABR4GWV5_9EURO
MAIANECFERLKAYCGYDGKLSVFRTDHNAARMQMSCSRLSLPWADETGLQQLIHALLAHPTVSRRAGAKSMTTYILLSYMPRVDAVPSGMKLLTSPDDMVRWAVVLYLVWIETAFQLSRVS